MTESGNAPSTARPRDGPADADVAVVGAGAAGLMAAIAAGEAGARVLLFNAHAKVGLKILMSGGTRCNVTHERVGPESFHGGSRNAVGLVLKAFPAETTRAWFEGIGVALKVEPGGKLFPVTDSAQTVLDALVARAGAAGVRTLAGAKVTAVRRDAASAGAAGTFVLETPGGSHTARAVILTTGGLSFPKTGSDGSGYELARSLGHSLAATTPALTPLVLAGELHTRLQGLTLPAALTLRVGGKKEATCAGSLLFTHFGLSGPAALDLSRHWLRVPEGLERRVEVHFLPGPDLRRAEEPGGLPERAALEAAWLAAAAADPRATVQSHLTAQLPVRLVRELAAASGVDHARPLGQVPKDARRRLLEQVLALPVEVVSALGYEKAEVTAGGVPLSEVDPRRMASRSCPGLHLAGEILDVDGRLGGYNFQWAWSSGQVAGRAAAAWARPTAAGAPASDTTAATDRRDVNA
ncbi:MAG: aminoacetone oxidase family FAD-binding enzyme [Planctomycetes bacterium]|nr:aminoacetone oxidase family FAD-binding enzyme [Planctomycetota bacterium]